MLTDPRKFRVIPPTKIIIIGELNSLNYVFNEYKKVCLIYKLRKEKAHIACTFLIHASFLRFSSTQEVEVFLALCYLVSSSMS